ncbi:sulfite exporter TauE/SafE family protein [Chlorogloeopsis sp. ULAP01]|uniref:sulfite exporter TauE/SafE family protein n=1 Tax=Chlorogloeopsis sp. ULAP01 TaxID=3056483 RepID=UPI0025AABA2A|nr:sulfite exporter TauE/SafE family protein [Chlorogloeopsis sp. ULAP01]MDM9381381.1 sulfite exporter TauE/SafE family protein [Chlorogloeopsis sp. ULAP01]
MDLILGIVLAICIGISLGLIGSGGSVLAVPLLIYILGVPPKSAIAMSLVIVGAVSLIGVIPHWQQGNVNLKIAALFSPTAMLGAYIGARIASLPIISPTFQLISFAIAMVVAAILMIRNNSNELDNSDRHKNYQWLAIPVEGLGVGILTGFVGIGGGFLIIPALVLLGKVPFKEALGTSLIVIALKSVTGFAGYFGRVFIDFNLMMYFTIAASVGTITGAYLTKFTQSKQLKTGFGFFMIAVAIFIVMKEYLFGLT